MRATTVFATFTALACAACGVLLGTTGDDDSTPPSAPPAPADAQPNDATTTPEAAVDTGVPDATAADANADADADANDATSAADVDAGTGCTVLFHDDFENKITPIDGTLWTTSTASGCTGPSSGVTPHGTGFAAFLGCTTAAGGSYFLTPNQVFPRSNRLRFAFGFQIAGTGDSIFLHATNVYADLQGFGIAVEHGTNTIYAGKVTGASSTALPANELSWPAIATASWHQIVVDISFANPMAISATLDGNTQSAAGPASSTTASTPTAFRFGIDHGAGQQKNLFDDVVISSCPP